MVSTNCFSSELSYNDETKVGYTCIRLIAPVHLFLHRSSQLCISLSSFILSIKYSFIPSITIITSWLDLSLLLPAHTSDCATFKLASITSLYLAVKVHNQKPFSARSLASLSRGEFLVEDITDMENLLLKALDWQLCPPTATSFSGYFCALLQPHIKSSVKRTILQRSCFFSELGVMDSTLMTMSGLNQSEIAFAAILNSMSGVSSTLCSNDDKNDFVEVIEQCSGMDSQSISIKMAQEALWVLYHRSTQYSMYDSCKITKVKNSMMRIQCTLGTDNMMNDCDVLDNIVSPSKASKKHHHCSNE